MAWDLMALELYYDKCDSQESITPWPRCDKSTGKMPSKALINFFEMVFFKEITDKYFKLFKPTEDKDLIVEFEFLNNLTDSQI
jgi:hypothetical protein